jgi:hypothetical protein
LDMAFDGLHFGIVFGLTLQQEFDSFLEVNHVVPII